MARRLLNTAANRNANGALTMISRRSLGLAVPAILAASGLRAQGAPLEVTVARVVATTPYEGAHPCHGGDPPVPADVAPICVCAA